MEFYNISYISGKLTVYQYNHIDEMPRKDPVFFNTLRKTGIVQTDEDKYTIFFFFFRSALRILFDYRKSQEVVQL